MIKTCYFVYMADISITIFEDSKQLRESPAIVFNGTAGFTCSGAHRDCSDRIYNTLSA